MKAEQHIRTVETHDRADNVVGTKEVVLYAGLNPKATMPEVAEALMRQGCSGLQQLPPRRPSRSELGLKPGQSYWLHIFDALAIGRDRTRLKALKLQSVRRTLDSGRQET